MALPELFLQDLKLRNSIEDIASSYVQFKRRGRNMVGLCPFHNEKTPSFHLYPESGSFYCFGCGVGGDVITFIRRIENLDYIEAVKFLADRAGLPMPETGVDDTISKLRVRILEINRETARFYHSVLRNSEGKKGLDYFLQRHLLPATITHFGLGFAPATRFALVDHLKNKGYTVEEMIQSNVAVKTRSGRVADRFFNRVMFPIIDLRGNVIAFGGRTMTDQKPKYLNTSDTLVFKKSYGLFAMNFAKNSEEQQLILAEGYMDVIALHQAGFVNAIAGLGTALTTEQVHLISRYAKEVILAYDADQAGQKATSRAIEMLRSVGLQVKILSITGGKDPDEYIRSFGEQGAVRFKQLIEKSGNDVEYRLQKIKTTCNMQTPAGKVQYLNKGAELLATLNNPIEQEIYAGKLAEEANVERRTVLLLVKRFYQQRYRSQEKKEFREFQQQVSGLRDHINPDKRENLRAANAEEAIIAYLFQNPDMAQYILSMLPPEKFSTAFNRRVYKVIVGRMMNGVSVSLTDISDIFNMEEISSIARILAKYHEVSVRQQDAEKYINIILEEKFKLNIHDVQYAQTQDIQNYLARLRKQKQ